MVVGELRVLHAAVLGYARGQTQATSRTSHFISRTNFKDLLFRETKCLWQALQRDCPEAIRHGKLPRKLRHAIVKRVMRQVWPKGQLRPTVRSWTNTPREQDKNAGQMAKILGRILVTVIWWSFGEVN